MQLIVAPAAKAPSAAQALLQVLPADYPAVERSALVELMETILVYKLPALGREEIRKMLDISEVDIKKTQFYQEVYAEGHQEGYQKGEARLVIRLLHRQLGDLPDTLEARIQALPVESLESLSERLQDFSTVEDLAQWLHG